MQRQRLFLGLFSAAAPAFCLLGFALAADAQKISPARAEYDFHNTAAYRALSAEEKAKLDTVQRDFALLWGALDRYAVEHWGQVPKTLAELVPRYLSQLPSDPLAKDEGEYCYRPGGENAWCLSSAGLEDFPFLAREGNVGLHVSKGFWTGGKNVTETRQNPSGGVPEQELYDFRDTVYYRALSPEQKAEHELVWRDLTMLWGALDMYAQRHQGKVPASLAELVPLYLPKLPSDPFAAEAAAEQRTKDGRYGYQPGGSEAWVLSSAGGKGRLYVLKGVWFGGVNVAH